jgi:hypothetical protein
LSRLERAWLIFHEANPQVWGLYERFCWEAINAGKVKLSVSLITERIRWEVWIVTKASDGFKINNNHRAYYARKWNRENRLEAQFELRRVQGENGEEPSGGWVEVEMP